MTQKSKKKLLIIVENIPVPFDVRVWNEACSLRDAGYQVSVLSPRGKGYTQMHEVLDDIHIFRHPMPKESESVVGYLMEYACALFWEFLFTVWIFMSQGFHVIQGCNPPDTIFLVALPFRIFGVKYIFDQHDANPELYHSKYERKDFLYKVLLSLEGLTYRASDVVIATNESYKELAVSRGKLNPNDVFVVRNGPDLERFKLAPAQSALKHGKPYLVGYVGNMSIQEGLDILVDVALRIKNLGRTDVHFTCVGGGTSLIGLRELVKEKGLEDMMNFTGRISDGDLLDILSTADVCVNPDKPCEMNDISTMIKIAEYMALGKPIVQFTLTEGRVTAGDSALYANNDDPVADFADKILWLLDRPEERQRMGECGRKRVEERFAWKHSVPNLIAAYQRVFDKPLPNDRLDDAKEAL
jgi:glycosyltransferase involved in cell wall biosynthesis